MKKLGGHNLQSKALSVSTLIYMFGVAVSAAITLILVLAISHYLTPQEYGLFAIYQLLSSFLLPALALNTAGIISIEFHRRDSSLRAELNGTILYIFAATLSIVVAAVSLSGPYIAALLGVNIFVIFLALMTSAGQFLVNWKSQIWQLENKPTLVAFTLILTSITNALLSVILVVIVEGEYIGRISAQTAAVTFAAFICISLGMRSKDVNFSNFNIAESKRVISYGLQLLPHTIGLIAVSTADRFLINENLSKSDLGIYTVALQLSLVVSMATGAFNQAYMPWLFESLSKPDSIRNKRILNITTTYFVFVFFASLLFAFVVRRGSILFLDSAYHGVATLLVYLCLGHAFHGMYLMVNNFLYFKMRNKSVSAITIACGLFYILLLLLFVGDKGLSFVAFAFALTNFLKFLVTFFLVACARDSLWRLSK